jgi:carboxyl-terminal processing protease
MSKDMTKKALRAVVVLLIGAAIFAGFKYAERPAPKDQLIIQLVQDALENFHFQPKPLNDELSKEVMASYLENLDGNRLFFTADDVAAIRKYDTKIDDEFKTGSSECFDVSYDLLQKGLVRGEKIADEILEQPFDFDKNESTWSNPEKLAWAKTEKELRDYWRKYLKWRVANRIYNREESNRKALEAFEKGETSEDEEAPKPWDFAAEEAEAREKEKEIVDEWFENLKEIERIEWLGVYVNSLAQVFDPHTEYMPPQQQEDFEVNMTGQFEGIGAQLRQDGDYIVIERVIPGSASSRQGDLQEGDKIIAVAQGDEEPVDVVGWRVDKAVKLIRGKKGTEVRLTVKRKDGSRLVIPIVRDVVELEATFARSAILGDDRKTGYIRLPKFYVDFYKSTNRNAAEDVKLEIEKLKASDVEGIIFDLRGNGGGSLEAAIEIVGLFIERGPAVQVKSSTRGTSVKQNRDARVYWDGPLVVLVNEYSASASEIFAAAIQDYGRGVIIGSKATFGKGTVQNMLNLDDALRGGGMADMAPLGALKITTEKFYRINGGTTQLEGVHSDIIFPSAYEYIKTGEQELDYALPVDKIAPATYTLWSKNNERYNAAIAASQKRIDGNAEMQRTLDYARWLQLQEEDREIPLNYAAFKKMQDEAEEVAGKFKSLNKSEVGFSVWPLLEPAQEAPVDSVKMADNKKWMDAIGKDLQVQEAITVVRDLK